jgi:hypothetical protein
MRRPTSSAWRGAAWILLLLPAALLAAAPAGEDRHRGPEPADGVEAVLAPAESIKYSARITRQTNIGLYLTNFGFFGNNLANKGPSLEFPLGTSQEHLVRAGLWVAAVTSNGDTLTTTGTIAGTYGSLDPRMASEFTPADTTIYERSNIINNRYYHPDARSEQDFLCTYSDRPGIERTGEDHRPLGLLIRQETLVWSFEPLNAFVIVNWDIINNNIAEPISFFNLYAGLYAELATGNKNYQNFASGWFDRKNIAYYDSIRTVSEHRENQGQTAPPNGVTSWAGYKLLGTSPDSLSAMDVTFDWWHWDTERDFIYLDAVRYGIMSRGESRDASSNEASDGWDPVEILSVGPFPTVFPGDTVHVSFAWVAGNTEEELVETALWAQQVYDSNFRVPLPPPSPHLLVEPGENEITLRWDDSPVYVQDPKSGKQDFEGFRIYVSRERDEARFDLLAQYDVVDDTLGYDTGFEALADTVERPDPITGELREYQYRYDITGLRDGFKYYVAVTSYDTGSPADNIASLESGKSQNLTLAVPGPRAKQEPRVRVFPNPYRGDAVWDGSLSRDRYLWFINLPSKAKIRIYTLAGDLVDTIDFDGARYHATEIRGIFDPTDPKNPETDLPQLSGGMVAWDMITKSDQGIASGLYLFSVEDLESGKTEVGKFLVIK